MKIVCLGFVGEALERSSLWIDRLTGALLIQEEKSSNDLVNVSEIPPESFKSKWHRANKNNKTDKEIILKTHRHKHSPSAERKCQREMINPLMLNNRNHCPTSLLL